MKTIEITLLLIFTFSFHSYSQEIIFGSNKYIEYQKGTLPIVISVPHGGNLSPLAIPDRTCNNPANVTDAYTIEVAHEINRALFELTGCYPYIVYCHLKRSKLDCNRNVADGACGNSDAVKAWNEFHGFIKTAQNTVSLDYENNLFFIDLHGHGNPIQRVELGYLLYDYELELPDETLNTAKYLNFSSVKNLALNNSNNYTHAELLRGSNSLGTMLANKGFPAVPSSQIPFPGTTTNYYSGGYITATHTCYTSGNNVNGVQMELNYTGIRDNQTNRRKFSDSLSRVLCDYMDIHRSKALRQCSVLGTIDNSQDGIKIYPNPLNSGSSKIFTAGLTTDLCEYRITDVLGCICSIGFITGNQISLTEKLKSNIYIVMIKDKKSNQTIITKLLVR